MIFILDISSKVKIRSIVSSMLAANIKDQHNKFLYGKPVVDQIYRRITKNFQTEGGLRENPTIAILTTNYRPDTEIYVKKKIHAMRMFGINYIVEEEMNEFKQMHLIEQWNQDPKIDGILIQLPLGPKYPSELVNSLKLEKDIDGIKQGNPFFKPCTASAVIELIHHYNIKLTGKEVVVVGKGQLVGIPVSL